ncbi:MAG TPA: hypothetical protein VGL46_12680 [Pseudonocardiaceae bacterium]|jgi:hypothetical protein
MSIQDKAGQLTTIAEEAAGAYGVLAALQAAQNTIESFGEQMIAVLGGSGTGASDVMRVCAAASYAIDEAKPVCQSAIATFKEVASGHIRG